MTNRLFDRVKTQAKHFKLKRKEVEVRKIVKEIENIGTTKKVLKGNFGKYTDNIQSNQPPNLEIKGITTNINNKVDKNVERNQANKTVDSYNQPDKIISDKSLGQSNKITSDKKFDQPDKMTNDKSIGQIDKVTRSDKIDQAFDGVYVELENYFTDNQSLLDTVSHLTAMDHLTDLLKDMEFSDDYPQYLREQSLCEVNR